MRLTRIGRNTVLRLALIYAGVFSASILLLFGFIYWRTGGYLARQTDDLILADVEDLTEVYAAGGTTGLVSAIADQLQEDPQGRLLYLLEDSAAHRLAGNLGRWPAVSSADGWVDFTVPSPRTPAKRSRPARARLVAFSDDVRLLVGRDIYSERRLTFSILQALGWGLALTLALGVLGGIVTSLGMVRRLEAINRTSRGIIEGDLSRRVPIRDANDEFDELARNLNRMLDRIQALMATVKGVSDNIAHDLRTPMARVKTRLEMVRSAPPPPGEYEAWVDETMVCVDSVLDTFEALLKIAEVEAGGSRQSFATIDLTGVVADVAEFYEPLAEDNGQRLSVALRPVPAVIGNRDLLFRALANLVDNAIKYTPAGGHVEILLEQRAGLPEVVIADNGPGIPENARQEVFQRMHRLEASRCIPGSGLGLSLVAAVADLHGIVIRLDDNQPGLKVHLTFELAVRAATPVSDATASEAAPGATPGPRRTGAFIARPSLCGPASTRRSSGSNWSQGGGDNGKEPKDCRRGWTRKGAFDRLSIRRDTCRSRVLWSINACGGRRGL